MNMTRDGELLGETGEQRPAVGKETDPLDSGSGVLEARRINCGKRQLWNSECSVGAEWPWGSHLPPGFHLP